MRRLFLIALLPLTLAAQTGWIKTYGTKDYEKGISIDKTNDGGYIVLGYVGYYSPRQWLLKLDSHGDTIWTRDLGGPQWGTCIKQTKDGGYIITGGSSEGEYGGKLLLKKIDQQGKLVWEKSYKLPGADGDHGYCVSETSDGGFIITGTTEYLIDYNPNYALLLLKTNSQGDLLWTKVHKTSWYGERPWVDLRGNWVEQTTDGGYIVTGKIGMGDNFSRENDIWVLKTNGVGDTIWTRTYGSGESWRDGSGSCVKQTNDGGYVVTGYITTGLLCYEHIALNKTDSKGNYVWEQLYTINTSDEPWDVGYSVSQTKDGGYFVLGTTGGRYSSGDIVLLSTNPSGEIEWQRIFAQFNGSSGTLSSDGGYVMTGTTSINGNGDLFVLKVDSTGGGIPLRIRPTKITSPAQSWKHTPWASYTNMSTEDYPYDLYCHCEIFGLNDHNSDYHDSIAITGGLKSFETKEIAFDTFTTKSIDNYKAIFYLKSPAGPPFPTDTMSVDFKYDPLEIGENQAPVVRPVLEVVSSTGREIALRYSNYTNGFHGNVFDASGRKVSEILNTKESGTLTWGEGVSPGVYFIRVESAISPLVQKVVLVR